MWHKVACLSDFQCIALFMRGSLSVRGSRGVKRSVVSVCLSVIKLHI